MSIHRRDFLKTSAWGLFASGLACSGSGGSGGGGGGAPPPPATPNTNIFGPLQADPQGVLDLPPGFQYRILETAGAPMDDGLVVPGKPDGMACFAGPAGTLILMRNHEVSFGDTANGPYPPGVGPVPEAYDPGAMGGVTRLVLDATSFDRISSNLVLAGTTRNCAGGVSPWGWLSCEESFDDNHGYVFLCPTDAASVQPAQRLTTYGRFNHEAATVDPATNIAYMTEDRPDGCLYRFVPDPGETTAAGRLQALKIAGAFVFDTSNGFDGSQSVEWVDIDTPDPINDAVRFEAQSKGAAIIRRGEGIWFDGGFVYICATTGGPAFLGQVLRLSTDPASQSLELISQSPNPGNLDKPDNITVAPGGDIFVAEDGDNDQFIRALTVVDGRLAISDFARNALSGSEMAGVCFSPDKRAMFVNIQREGLTLAITGPF